jgi:SAM-dependent methyltransferase
MTAPQLLYTQLAEWWPLISAPEEYEEEAEVYGTAIVDAAQLPVRAVLELGSGGGNNASHLKRRFEMTLVDLAPAMLDVSRRLNPECRHLEGDMRSVRVGSRFDAVFIHDAVDYMVTENDLAATMRTAAVHCRPGGALVVAPDYVRETFRPGVETGGNDAGDRGARYLDWTWDPDPADTTYRSELVLVLRDGEDVRVVLDRHTCGLFPEATWLAAIEDAGFAARAIAVELAPGHRGVLCVGTRRADV